MLQKINERWMKSKWWESLSMQVAGLSFDLGEKRDADGPHVLFHSADTQRLSQFARAFIQEAAAQFSPQDVNFFVVDAGDQGVYRFVQQFPHFAGGICCEADFEKGLNVLEDEGKRREICLKEHEQNHAAEYARLRAEGKLSGPPMPCLMIVICGYPEKIMDAERMRLLSSVLRRYRSCEGHGVMLMEREKWDECIHAMCRYQQDLDQLPESGAAAAGTGAEALRLLAARSGMQARALNPGQSWSWSVVSDTGEVKTLSLTHGDLCQAQEECDVVVCSAYKGDYFGSSTSLIGALEFEREIAVWRLSRRPELDFREMGCWLSQETGKAYRRVACVELLDRRDRWTMRSEEKRSILLRRSFSTLRFILEQADIAGIPVKTVALPILGAGDEDIEPALIYPALISQCRAILKSNPGVEKLMFYEVSHLRASQMAEALNEVFALHERIPTVFISYNSKQVQIAQEIRTAIEGSGITCWMAPSSIPGGESYWSAIPVALSQVKIVLLILTPEAEKSPWVQREVAMAIGGGKTLLPYQLERYAIGNQFRFALDGAQIIYYDEGIEACADADAVQKKHQPLLERIRELLNAM